MTDLERKFIKAIDIASAMTKKLPSDVMLRFYAYYKHATSEGSFEQPSGTSEVRNAFKLNAWFQINNISVDEAKKRYIELVEKYTDKKIN